MKPSIDQTCYDLPGVPFTADSKQIQAACHEMLFIYDNSSLSTYSLLTESERQTIRTRDQEAHQVLKAIE